MDVDGAVTVVTGGGSGIGRALAQAFAVAGASVVIGDLDLAGAENTAAGIRSAGGAAVALQADASTTDGIDALLNLAADEFGPVDIYVANAGIIGAPDLGAEDEWDRILEVNLRAHIRAAKLVVPDWQARSGGHFVSVASAAGLLSQLGAAGYAVTKHAAVGFAEWLAITYGDEGIGVSCVCPLGVDTPLLDSVRSADGPGARLSAESILQSGSVLGADEVAAATVDAVRAGRFMVLPHPQVLGMYQRKGADYDGWIAGMRRYQRSLG
jgi:NAD(P)-dependent dehydrogenase (short-subunit alcohol dehydrogenase family)